MYFTTQHQFPQAEVLLVWISCALYENIFHPVGTGIQEGVQKAELLSWDTDSGDKHWGAYLLYCVVASGIFIQPLDQWGIDESSGVANYPTVTMGRCQAVSTQRNFCASRGGEVGGSHCPVLNPFWGSTSLLESSILCHLVCQWTQALVLSERWSLPLILQVSPRGCSTHSPYWYF